MSSSGGFHPFRHRSGIRAQDRRSAMRNSTPCSGSRKAWPLPLRTGTAPTCATSGAKLCRERKRNGPSISTLRPIRNRRARKSCQSRPAAEQTISKSLSLLNRNSELRGGPAAPGAPVFHGVDDHRDPQSAFGNYLLVTAFVRLGLVLRVVVPIFACPLASFGSSPPRLLRLRSDSRNCIRKAKRAASRDLRRTGWRKSIVNAGLPKRPTA